MQLLESLYQTRWSTYGKPRRMVSLQHCLRASLTTEGLYEQQDSDQPEHNLRGKFYTDSDGKYAFYCLRPTPYPVSLVSRLVRSTPLTSSGTR